MAQGKQKKLHTFIYVDPKLCTGCETCESICSFVHDGHFNPINTRIHRVRIEPIINIALSCQKCEHSKCLRSCPEKAITKDEETGSIIIDENKCNGCGFCVRACDFGLITMNIDSQKAIACDLCKYMKDEFVDPATGKKEPQCVLVCPKQAISLKTVEQIGEDARIEKVKEEFAKEIKESQLPKKEEKAPEKKS